MKNLTVQEAFNRVFNGNKNFMTPDLERFETTDKYYIEVSSGSAMFGDGRMYGVTVITKNLVKCDDLSKSCHSLEEVQKHIDTLK